MDVFGHGTGEPSRPLLPPGTCWVCENSPQQEAMKVIDTRRNTRAGGSMSHESVRKYVCEPCARELGQAVGCVSPEEAAELRQAESDAKFENIALNERLEAAEAGQVKVVSVDSVAEFIDSLRAGNNVAEIEEIVKKSVPAKKAASVPPPAE